MQGTIVNPGFAFLVTELKQNQQARYGDLLAAASAKGLKVYPVMFGRAQAMLGIVKQSKRGAGKVARRKLQQRAAVRSAGHGSDQGRKSRGLSAEEALARVLEVIKSNELDRRRYRAALQRIQGLIAAALN